MPKGACLCGVVQFETSAALEAIDHCHCSRCRRSHGAAFATYGRVAKEHYQVTSGASHLRAFQSSEAVRRSFCDQCGSSLLFEHTALPDYKFIPVGALDDDPGSRPTAHIFAGSKASWYEITDALPQHDGYAPFETE
jgi:hypothetical protein